MHSRFRSQSAAAKLTRLAAVACVATGSLAATNCRFDYGLVDGAQPSAAAAGRVGVGASNSLGGVAIRGRANGGSNGQTLGASSGSQSAAGASVQIQAGGATSGTTGSSSGLTGGQLNQNGGGASASIQNRAGASGSVPTMGGLSGGATGGIGQPGGRSSGTGAASSSGVGSGGTNASGIGGLNSGGIASGGVASGGTNASGIGGLNSGGIGNAIGAGGSTAAGGAGGALPCPTDGSMLACSDFEDPLFSDWDRLSETSGASVTQTTGPNRFSGAGSLEATSVTTGGGFAYLSKDLPLVSSGQVFARAYFEISGPWIDEIDVLSLGDGTGQAGVAIMMFAESFGMRVTPSTDALQGGLSVPRDVWFCLELRVAIGDTNGVVEISKDGQSLLTLSNVDTLTGAGISNVRVGLPRIYFPQEPITVRMDNLRVSTSPIGCD